MRNKEVFNSNFGLISNGLEQIFLEPDRYRETFKLPREQAEIEQGMFATSKDRAILGDKLARQYIISQYTRILSSGIYATYEEGLIDYEDLQNNHVKILFEMMVQVYDLAEIVKKYGFNVRVTEPEFRAAVDKEAMAIKEYFSTAVKQRQLIATFVYTSIYGQDCIDTIQHHNINEIGIIDKDYVYVIVDGSKIHLEFLGFEDANIILNIQKKVTQNSPINYDEQNISIVTSKYNSSRITVSGYDITPDVEDFYYNERIFNLSNISLEEMRDTYKTIDDFICQFLVLNQQGRGSHFVTGSDMGVGKSTFLLAMMEKVPDEWGIGILDTQNELQAKKKYPHKNINTLLESTKRNISECFAHILKMSRDVLYVGEMTKPEEAAELINAVLRLNSGVGATMHSLSPYEVVPNLRNLMMRTDMYTDAGIAESDISRGLDLVIHLSRIGKRIVVDSIVEVVNLDITDIPDTLLQGSIKERWSRLVNLMQMAVSKYLFPRAYKYNTLVKYNREKDSWDVLSKPTDRYYDKLGIHAPDEEILKVQKLFEEKLK